MPEYQEDPSPDACDDETRIQDAVILMRNDGCDFDPASYREDLEMFEFVW